MSWQEPKRVHTEVVLLSLLLLECMKPSFSLFGNLSMTAEVPIVLTTRFLELLLVQGCSRWLLEVWVLVPSMIQQSITAKMKVFFTGVAGCSGSVGGRGPC